jgi:hypothetical protein
VLRRRVRVSSVDALVVIVVYALVAATISLQEAPQVADSINASLGIAVLVVGLAISLRRPAVVLRPTGLTVRGQTVAWPDITGIYDVHGLRSRYVRIFVASQRQYWRLPTLTTTRIWPGAGYARDLSELNRFARAYTDGSIEATTERRGPGWLYPVFAVVVLAVPVVINDPVDYWLPRHDVTHMSATCDVDLTGGRTTDGMTIDSPMLPGTLACQRRGLGYVVVEQVLLFRRSAVLNGSGVAHALFDTCSFARSDGSLDQATRPGPLAADEVSASGYRSYSDSGIYLIARRANAIVFVGYTNSAARVVAAWPCDWHKDRIGNENSPSYETTMAVASPADVTLATDVARRILDGLS